MIRVYRAPQIGTGTWDDPFRSILHDFIDPDKGDSFTEIDNPVKKVSICVLNARQSVHDAIFAYRQANPGQIIYLSDLLSDRLAYKGQLEQRISSFPLSFRSVLTIAITADGGMIDGTLRAVIKSIILKYFEAQKSVSGDKAPLPTRFIFDSEDY